MLRDAAARGGRLYILAGDRLIVFPGPPTPGMPLTCTRPQSYARPTLYGSDVVSSTREWVYPIEDGTLPEWPRVYPGAGRIYRVGVHRGVDIFFWNGPADFGFDTPAIAMASGRVVGASVAYEPMTAEEFNAMVAETNLVGYTPESLLDRFAGKQVIIDHGAGRFSVYSHLDEIAPEITPGEIVRAGQALGTVGVTGTQGEAEPGTAAPHLHFEILLGEHYLGYGITVNEAMWWYAQIFEDEAP